MPAMNREQIKAAIKAKGYTIKAFAEILGIAYDTLRRVLSGNKPLTEQLRRHIMLALQRKLHGKRRTAGGHAER